MSTITLEGMKFKCHIGTTAEERKIGNDFEVTVSYNYDTTIAGTSDSLNDTVDYSLIYNAVAEEMKQECNLIENVAHRVFNRITINFPMLTNLKVKICKYYPSVGGFLERSVIELP